LVVGAAAFLAGCAEDLPTTPTHPGELPRSYAYGATIPVTNETELYDAVSNPLNAGATLVLAPRVYKLDSMRVNKGRLELQNDMSLRGVSANAAAVVIDASELQASSYDLDSLQTGAVRVGRGHNTLFWLTVQGAMNGVAGIEADLSSGVPSRVTISHVVVQNNRRGIDLRNIGSSASGRVLIADITDSELRNNTLQMGQGIRIVNQACALNAMIAVTLARNIIQGNRVGCLAANNNTSYGTITVGSMSDLFDKNGVNCGMAAAVGGGTVPSNNNTVSFTSQGSTFRNSNDGPPAGVGVPRAGFTVEGASSSAAHMTSFNTALVVLLNPVFLNNFEKDLRAWGARSTSADGSHAGTNNTASVVIAGAPNASVESNPVYRCRPAPTRSAL
jgi:hypothetical protein